MRRGQGFTLLEVMIAVAFIAVAAVAVLRTQGQGILLADQARFTARAVFLARQVLNETHAQDDLFSGQDNGAFPGPLSEFTWQRQVTPVSGFPGLYKIQIRVRKAEDSSEKGVTLTGFTYREQR